MVVNFKFSVQKKLKFCDFYGEKLATLSCHTLH